MILAEMEYRLVVPKKICTYIFFLFVWDGSDMV